MRRAWGALSHPLVVGGARAAARHLHGLAFQRDLRIAGVPCAVYASADPAAPRPGDKPGPAPGGGLGGGGGTPRDVLLYCHGGAFLASLHAADLMALADWARATGATVVVPDYDFAPEHPSVPSAHLGFFIFFY